MNTLLSPIALTTSLSVLLHGAVVVALLAINEQAGSDFQAVGKDLDIELVSSLMVADQLEVDQQSREPVIVKKIAKSIVVKENVRVENTDIRVISTVHDDSLILTNKLANKTSSEDFVQQEILNTSETDDVSPLMQSTNANAQHHSILELLHSSISSNKKYPYLARRQRREGVTRIAFVLYPDGRIENAELINSSQVVTLDRAALLAVEGIQPFVAARDYLQQAEEFQVDVVFKLL